MAESTVPIQTGVRGYEPVYQALDLINFNNVLTNYNRVVIKVNFITDKTWDTGATTDPLVVEAIIRARSHTARAFVKVMLRRLKEVGMVE